MDARFIIRLVSGLFLIFSLFLPGQVSAQSAKSYAKEAKELMQAQKFEAAAQKYTAALQLNPKEDEWLSSRAFCLAKLKKYKEAIEDFKGAMAINPKNVDYCESAGECLFLAGEYAACMEMFARVSTQYYVVSESAVERIAESRIYLKDFDGAINQSNEAINDFKDNETFYFFRAAAYDSLKNYQAALLSYQNAVNLLSAQSKGKNSTGNSRMLKYLKSLARVQLILFQNEECRKSIKTALAIQPSDSYLILLRARVNAEEKAFETSLEDYNTYLRTDSSMAVVFYERAVILKRLGQFINAAKDLSVIIRQNDTAASAYELRAKCYEDIGNFRQALRDFKKFKETSKASQKVRAENALKRIEAKVYESEKESAPPVLKILSPDVIASDMSVSKSTTYLSVKGIVEDQSLIKSLSADGVEAEFSKDSLNPSFRLVINVTDKEEISFRISDIYLNVTSIKYKFSRAEKKAPEIKLFIPMSNINPEIFHDPSQNPLLKLSGKVIDESFITQIVVNGFQVNFDARQINPDFNFDLKLSTRDSVKISVTDEYGNKSVFRYAVNAKEAASIRNNPMGRTWLVFVENSDYLDFEKLDGPSKDAESIKSAIANYRFDNIITKRNQSLQALDKFFRIELRDLIKQQQVNSVMIWFAGHGKFLHGSGYWIPSDARKNEEASYFPISNLRGYLENYGAQLKHILIVSDACESGDAFKISGQSAIALGSCSDTKARESASVVFSSTASEKASDNSVFAKSFASALQGNSASCISLSDISVLVSDAVEKNQRQTTSLGLIKGLPNDGGTFLFMKSVSKK